MLDVKELFESLTDKEKEELRKLLLSHTDEVEEESPKEDTFANVAIIDPLQKEEVETQAPEVQEPEVKEPEVEVADLTVSEKQEFLVKFGYDPTNVKYMNTDILGQAYDSALKIRDAEAGGEPVTAMPGLPTEG